MSDSARIMLIPAFEPKTELITLTASAKQAGFIIVVVDDGSGSCYEDIFTKVSEYAVVLHHNENRGKGVALKTGMEYISKNFNPPYTVTTADADGQHRVSDAVNVCKAAEENLKALILGSRMLNENVPIRSKIGNTITRFVFKFMTKLSVYDTQTGLRAFSSELLPLLLEIDGERYEYEMNVLLEFAKSGYVIKEVPISTIYIDNNRGSHFNTVKDSYRIYKEILKFGGSSFVSFLIDYLLYSAIGTFMPVSLANISARIVSGSINFTLNRNLIFKNKDNIFKAAVKYFALAVFILVCNTIILNLLVYNAGINKYIAKIIVEILFFMFSWWVQHTLIFPKGKERK